MNIIFFYYTNFEAGYFIKGSFLILNLFFASYLFDTVAMTTNPQGNIILELTQEAQELKSSNQKTWENNLKEIETILLENFEIIQHWKNRGAPPLPSIEHLNLPLPLLADELQKHPVSDFLPCYAYFTAIAKNPDRRRIKLLEAYVEKLEQDRNFSSLVPRLMTNAADIEWATQQIPILIKKENYVSTYSFLFCLLDRFAKDLPENLRSTTYNHIRHYWLKGPTNGEGERYWDLLIRIDPERARQEIIPYFDQFECDLYVVRVLEKNASPSKEIAQTVKRWLVKIKKRDYEIYGTSLRILLLKSAPETELINTTKIIDSNLAKLKRNHKLKNSLDRNPMQEEIEDLLRSIVELDLDEAVEPLINYIHRQEISDITRFNIIEWLVKRQHKQLPNILARWLKEEQDYLQNWVRSSAKENWGSFGQKVLQKAEKLVNEKHKNQE